MFAGCLLAICWGGKINFRRRGENRRRKNYRPKFANRNRRDEKSFASGKKEFCENSQEKVKSLCWFPFEKSAKLQRVRKDWFCQLDFLQISFLQDFFQFFWEIFFRNLFNQFLFKSEKWNVQSLGKCVGNQAGNPCRREISWSRAKGNFGNFFDLNFATLQNLKNLPKQVASFFGIPEIVCNSSMLLAHRTKRQILNL